MTEARLSLKLSKIEEEKEFKIEDFVSKLLSARTQAHIFHWQSSTLSEHLALEEFYKEITKLTDKLVESYQGKNNIINGYKNVDLITASSLFYFESLSAFIKEKRSLVFVDSCLNNIIDEIEELIYKTIYKLKYLK